MKKFYSQEGSSLKIIFFAATVALHFTTTATATYLPEKDRWSRRFAFDIDEAPVDLLENTRSHGTGGPTNAIGTLVARWLVAEYNRRGFKANKMYSLSKQPVSNCGAKSNVCRVEMLIEEVGCDLQSDAENCLPIAYELKKCIAVFDMKTSQLKSPVLCDVAAEYDDEENLSEIRDELSELMAREAFKQIDDPFANSASPLSDLEVKKWDKKDGWSRDDGMIHPI